MKTSTWLLIGAGVVALYIYSKKMAEKKAVAAAVKPAVPAPGVHGWNGCAGIGCMGAAPHLINRRVGMRVQR